MLGIAGSRAQWVQETYITEDTETIGAEANERSIGRTTELYNESKRFDGLDLG